jgi:hypothetical protein
MSRRHLASLLAAILLPASALAPAIADQWPIYNNGRLHLPSIFGHKGATPTQTKMVTPATPGRLDRSITGPRRDLDGPRPYSQFGVFYGYFDDGSQGHATVLDRPVCTDSVDDGIGFYWIHRFR